MIYQRSKHKTKVKRSNNHTGLSASIAARAAKQDAEPQNAIELNSRYLACSEIDVILSDAAPEINIFDFPANKDVFETVFNLVEISTANHILGPEGNIVVTVTDHMPT